MSSSLGSAHSPSFPLQVCGCYLKSPGKLEKVGVEGEDAHLSPGCAAARRGVARAPLTVVREAGLRSSSQSSPVSATQDVRNSTSYSRASNLGGSLPGVSWPTHDSTPCSVHTGGWGDCVQKSDLRCHLHDFSRLGVMHCIPNSSFSISNRWRRRSFSSAD